MTAVFDIATAVIFIAAIGLCAWGAVKAQVLAAKIVCGSCGAAFVAGIVALLWFRAVSNHCEYKTTTGLCVIGSVEMCPQEQAERWASRVETVWADLGSCAKLSGARLVCADQYALSTFGRLVRGYESGGTAVIGTSASAEALAAHELSHVVVERCKGPLSEEAQHKLLSERGM